MSVEIKSVEKNTPAYSANILPGDVLLSVNENKINDVLDYMFYTSESALDIKLLRNGEEIRVSLRKNQYDDLGLNFSTYLMDEKQSCRNKCIFCFIDQMPPNMRETLYFKDDDARLSFLHGNYVTLTNLSDEDVERIIKMRLNINVSVHTTNPELRCKMMNNRFAGEKLSYLKKITESGLSVNCQIVLCPGINDGDELERTLDDLADLMPNVESVAVVPVGLTKFREGLFELNGFDMKSAGEALDLIERKQKEFYEKFGKRLVYAADEFYIKARRELPKTEYYEDYPQYENGVGLVRSLSDEVNDALLDVEWKGKNRHVSIATGVAAGSYLREMVAKIEKMCNNFTCNVYEIRNEFFGETITVAGLLTAKDLITQLQGKELGEYLFIPSVMLRADSDVFLDDLSVSDVEKALKIKIIPVSNDGYDFVDKLLFEEK